MVLCLLRDRGTSVNVGECLVSSKATENFKSKLFQLVFLWKTDDCRLVSLYNTSNNESFSKIYFLDLLLLNLCNVQVLSITTVMTHSFVGSYRSWQVKNSFPALVCFRCYHHYKADNKAGLFLSATLLLPTVRRLEEQAWCPLIRWVIEKKNKML